MPKLSIFTWLNVLKLTHSIEQLSFLRNVIAGSNRDVPKAVKGFSNNQQVEKITIAILSKIIYQYAMIPYTQTDCFCSFSLQTKQLITKIKFMIN